VDFVAAEKLQRRDALKLHRRRIIVKKEVRVLVLTRKIDEQIVIQLGDQDVIVQVVAIDCDRVRLGVIAPREVPVHREEVLRRIDAAELTAV
jgi:carbon storage regulator